MHAIRPLAGLLAGLLAVLLCGTARADTSDFRCLRSVDTKKPVRLQFTWPDKTSVGYVLYEHGSAPIPVKAVHTESVETAPDRPHEFTTTWKEIGPRGSGGTYTVISQGARIYHFEFVGGNGRKRVGFIEDFNAPGPKGCVWGSLDED